MGSNLVGYHYCGPENFSEEALEKAKAYYDRLQTRRAEIQRELDAKADQTGEDWEENDPYVILLKEIFKELDTNEPAYMDDEAMDFSSAIHEYNNGEEFIYNLVAVWGGSGRDVSARTATVGGEKISIVFAGERTWGDSPDGMGFSLFRSIYAIPNMEEILGLF